MTVPDRPVGDRLSRHPADSSDRWRTRGEVSGTCPSIGHEAACDEWVRNLGSFGFVVFAGGTAVLLALLLCFGADADADLLRQTMPFAPVGARWDLNLRPSGCEGRTSSFEALSVVGS